MHIIDELRTIAAQLPAQQAGMLKYWLKEFETARKIKQLKPYALAFKALADFEKAKSIASLN